MQFLLEKYIIIPKKEIGHNQKGTTLEPLGSLSQTLHLGTLRPPALKIETPKSPDPILGRVPTRDPALSAAHWQENISGLLKSSVAM